MSIKPQDILPDDQNEATLNGVSVRKGTVAAFIANIQLLESNPGLEERSQILQTLKALAPAVIATGLTSHATFNNPIVAEILKESK